MSGTIFSICSISAFSAQQAAPKCCRKNATWNRKRKNCGEVEADVEPGSAFHGKLSYSSELECITQSTRFESQSTMCRKTCCWRGSNQNEAASSSQMWLTDAKFSESARKLAAVDTNQGQSFPDFARKLAAGNLDINDEDDSKWPHLEKVCAIL